MEGRRWEDGQLEGENQSVFLGGAKKWDLTYNVQILCVACLYSCRCKGTDGNHQNCITACLHSW